MNTLKLWRKKIEYLNDEYIYLYDFEEELDYVVQVEDILGGSFENDGDMYFNLLDCHYEFGRHENIDVDHVNSSCAGIDKSKNNNFLACFHRHFFQKMFILHLKVQSL